MANDAIDDFHSAVLQWAERLGLEGEEHEEYVSFHMEKGGYNRATTWLPPEPDENKQGSGFMSKKRGAAGRQGQGGQGQGPGQQRRTPPSYFNGGGNRGGQ